MMPDALVVGMFIWEVLAEVHHFLCSKARLRLLISWLLCPLAPLIASGMQHLS
jgi:hypothetical protein